MDGERQSHHTFWANAIYRQVGDRSDALRTAALHVKQMLDSEGWKILAALLERRKQEALRTLTGPAVLDRSEYAAKANQIRVLEQVEQIGLVLLDIADEARQRGDEAARAHAAGSGGEDGAT